jgi:hypothetical protein
MGRLGGILPMSLLLLYEQERGWKQEVDAEQQYFFGK